MEIVDKVAVIRPAFLKVSVMLFSLRIILDPILDFLLWSKCDYLGECFYGQGFSDWLEIFFFAIFMAFLFRRIYAVTITNENSLSPNSLKGFGSARIDLTKNYDLSFVRGTLKIVQGKVRFKLNTILYSRKDIDGLYSILKI